MKHWTKSHQPRSTDRPTGATRTPYESLTIHSTTGLKSSRRPETSTCTEGSASTWPSPWRDSRLAFAS